MCAFPLGYHSGLLEIIPLTTGPIDKFLSQTSQAEGNITPCP